MENIRNLVSHRVVFEYQDGTMLTGYVAACRPAQGPVRILALTRVEISDEAGHVIEQHRDFLILASPLVNFRLAEGPSAQASS